MPVTCTCPTCNKPLRVPDELIGRLVRCPGCQGTFPASAAAPTPPAPPPPASPPQFQANPSSTSDLPNLSFDDAPQESFGDRANALALVKGPSLALMIVSCTMAGLSVLLFLGLVIFYSFVFSAADSSRGTTAPSSSGNMFGSIAVIVGINFVELLISVAWAIAVYLGASRMRQLRTYPFALTAAILAMVPLSGCVCGALTFLPWLVTIGFGIWALVILCKPEVKAAFE